MSEARVGDLAESRDYQRLSDLFARLGVRENPFGLREPDLEDPVRQATYFVPPPMFNEVLGRAEAPESVLVLAPRGAGKTTFRQQIARRCRDQLPPVTGVLDVTYADFSRPLAAAQAAGRAVTVRDHVEEIVRCAVERLIETINEVSVRKFAMLPGGKLATLSAYLRTYNWLLADDNRGDAIHALFERLAAGRGEQLGVDTSQLLHGDAAAIMAQLSPGLAPVAELLLKLHAQPARVLDTASYLGRLRDLLALLVALDYQAMYVLVDRLDEGEGLHDPDAAITFIAPLITDLKLLEEPHLACKFFLPDYLSDRLVAAGLRRKRLPTYHLKWSDDEILILLQRRLRGVSRYSSLREFCAPALRARLPEPPLPDHPQVGYIDLALVAAARELPRDLILRCRALFAHFAARGGDDYLTEADLAAALAAPLDPDNPPGLPDDPSLAVAPPAAPATAAVPTPPPLEPLASEAPDPISLRGLAIDGYEHVWRDGTQLSKDPRPLEFRLLQYLCAHRYRLCKKEDILRAIWGDGPYSDSTYNQTVHRLRQAVEYDPTHPQFILTVAGRGLRLEDGPLGGGDAP
jgi:DNA-binding response OmpR family regulator